MALTKIQDNLVKALVCCRLNASEITGILRTMSELGADQEFEAQKELLIWLMTEGTHKRQPTKAETLAKANDITGKYWKEKLAAQGGPSFPEKR